jgi:hypothetical protein
MKIGEFIVNKHNNRSYIYCGNCMDDRGDLIYALFRCNVNTKPPQNTTTLLYANGYVYYGLDVEDNKKMWVGPKDLKLNYVTLNEYINNRLLS